MLEQTETHTHTQLNLFFKKYAFKKTYIINGKTEVKKVYRLYNE